MKKFYSNQFKESYYEYKLANGLTILLMPKEDYKTSYGILTIKYGALDNEFIPYNKKKYCQVPLGIAHFLEHKMFEMPKKIDINNLFASIGADVNAYTTYNHTGYFFSTTKDIESSLKYLLDLVFTKSYTKKTIKEEVPIIKQELMMYLDNPDIVLNLESCKSMFFTNSIKEDIGGTLSSIEQINKKYLDLCYDTFYHPQNMILSLVGNFIPEQIIAIIEDNLKKKQFFSRQEIIRKVIHEDATIAEKYRERNMNIAIPKVSVNLKIGHEDLTPKELIKLDYAISMIMHQNFDIISNYFTELESEGIINNSFDFDVTIEKDYRYITINTDTIKINEFVEKTRNQIIKIKNEPILSDDFIRYKNICIAQIIRKMNSIEYLANIMTESKILNLDVFEYLDIINDLRVDDVMKARKYFKEDALTVVVIK